MPSIFSVNVYGVGSDSIQGAVWILISSVLEMMKERQLDAEQRKLFGEIEVYATEHLMEEVPADAENTVEEVAADGE